MENSNKLKLIEAVKKYKFCFVFITVIYILFFFASYSNHGNNYAMHVNGQEINLNKEIQEIDNKLYIHIDDLTKTFGENIYYDKISAKVIITTNQGVKKISKDDMEYILILEVDIYINVEKVVSDINYSIVICKNNIYIFNYDKIEATIVNNRTEIYNGKKVVDILNESKNVQIILDDLILNNNNNSKFVTVMSLEDNTYGTCLKENLDYEYIPVNEQINQEKIIIVKVGDRINNTLDTDNINAIAMDMLRLSGKNNVVELEYKLNVDKKIKIFATINNGQTLSNYDPDGISLMLNSDTNREEVSSAILKFVMENNLQGVNINFSNIKTSDKDLFTQYIKELTAVMKSHAKQVVVTVSNSQNVDLESITKTVDYVIIQTYAERTTASKMSGPTSSVNYVDNQIQKAMQKGLDVNKLIIEVPTYSILWTERGGTVINAETYTMSAIEEYIKLNNIKVKLDNNSKQNCFTYTKGITTYKMWLEDSYSVQAKAELVNKYNLAGISIYKNGMELKSIYKDIVKIFDK